MMDKIKKVIDEQVRPSLKLHSGDIELVDVDNDKVFIRFVGGCQGCAAADMTLKSGIESLIKGTFPEINEIVDLTNHNEGTNPYYKL